MCTYTYICMCAYLYIYVCTYKPLVAFFFSQAFAASLRALLAPSGKLVVICERAQSDSLLVDIQDAGFLQRRVAQIVTNRRWLTLDLY